MAYDGRLPYLTHWRTSGHRIRKTPHKKRELLTGQHSRSHAVIHQLHNSMDLPGKGREKMRDMNKIVLNVKVPEEYQLVCSEWLQLAKEARGPRKDDALDAVLKAFKYGFALAQRMEANKRKRGAAV